MEVNNSSEAFKILCETLHMIFVLDEYTDFIMDLIKRKIW